VEGIMSNIDLTLRDRLAAIVSAMGYEFVGCELHRQGRGSLLRIYIDKEQGITVEDCSKVSRQISAVLDVEDPIQGQYTLEVSSPGLDRPLFELAQYKKFIGNRVKVRLHTPLNERRNFVGDLIRVNEMNIHLLINAEEIVVPFSSIEKANVIADIR
jgi:ribosome maturation factor RimP